ncbi:hypothetical protein, partial [Maioricimonas sp. JC845]|uniref:hypothetical protein n=1 Tax=Maioricimonas sp. JC845 TaxID=3232138 RepID=UPI00345A70FB
MTVTVTGAAELGGDVTTTGLQSWGGAVTISGDTELDSSAGGGNIIFVADVSGDALLTVTAGTGDVTFQSTIGGVTPLSGLVLTANSVDFTGAIAVDDQGLMVTASTTT